MTNRITKTVSFTPEEQEQLDAICKDTGMKEATVIRQLIFKASKDQYCRKIITQQDYFEKQEKELRKLRERTSHNVHSVNEKKAGSAIEADQGNVVRVPLNYHNEPDADLKDLSEKMGMSIDRLIEVCKAKWIEDDDD